MRKVDRELFIPAEMMYKAYFDITLPIGKCQKISYPFIIAQVTFL